MKIQNRGYDKDIFVVTKEQKETALLPNVGRFCKCGCGKRIEGKVVTRKLGKGITTYYRKAQLNKEFFTASCKVKFYNRTTPRKLRPSLNALIGLKVLQDKVSYRELTLYLKNNHKLTLKITSEHKELWNVLEKICKYRYSKPDPIFDTPLPILVKP